MSTILRTLKKLEEEKSVLEKRLDLKEMVLQDDEESFYPVFSLKTSPKFLWGGVLFLAGVAVTFFWLWVDKPKMIQVSQVSQPAAVKLQSPVPVKKQSSSSVPGIPLSNIPEQAKRQLYNEPAVENNYYAVEKEMPDKNVVKPVELATRSVRGTVRQEQGIYEIQSLIASAKSLADEPEEIFIPQINSNLSIPSLKVKGIIFFSSGSSSNHIFVSTPKGSNQKVRVGDSIESATLLKIESNGAIFSYQGESVHLKIGG
ncbi:MAG: hypothetical protein H8E32_03665 [Nitrospinae bacterium]|nr:hypothetical protein [Nitrospinota bacterium]